MRRVARVHLQRLSLVNRIVAALLGNAMRQHQQPASVEDEDGVEGRG